MTVPFYGRRVATSNWIAIAATVIALFGLFVALAERKNRKRELHLLDTQVGLLRRQVEGEEAVRKTAEAAEIIAAGGGVNGGTPTGYDTHHFSFTNGGQGTAYDVKAWVKREDTSEDVTVPALVSAALFAQMKQPFSLPIPMEHSRRGGLILWARWRDGRGDLVMPLAPIGRHG